MSSAINPLASSAAATGAAPAKPAAPPTDPLASENVFLQLLVQQLKNQDPSSPADPTQFVSQLAQFTNLEQSTQMRTDLDGILSTLQTLAAAGTPPTATGALASAHKTSAVS
jgi:flagellar basal-body rod modification protein FlgD